MAATTLTSAGGSPGSRATLTKAYLELHDPQPGAAGSAALGAARGQITFQFNPSELTLRKAARWGAEPARGAQHTGPSEFQGAEPSTLDLEMFFDASVGGLDVAKTVDTLFACCVPTTESRGQRKPAPPLVVFHWGKITGFASFITSVSATYTLFTPEGTPIRATCQVNLQEIATEPAGQNPTSGALSVHRTHTLIDGETLAGVAARDYGSAAMWRRLAEVNGIDDPFRVAPGTTLVVPAPDEL